MPEPELPIEESLERELVPLVPVARQERIAAMDVLRGIAVLGIFLINMPLYVAPSAGFFDWENNGFWSGAADRIATLFIYIFAQGKFYTLFSFLFGLGFGVQLARAAARNAPDFLRIYRRRLAVLLLIGTLHFTLIWWGDVLHVYALLGFALLAFSEKSDRELLIWAACLTFIPFVLAVGGTTIRELTNKTQSAEVEKKRTEERKTEAARTAKDFQTKASGSIVEIFVLRQRRNLRQLGGEVAWATELFTSFLLGLWAARLRIFEKPRLHRPLLRKLAFIGLPLALLVTCADLAYGYTHPGQHAPLWRTHLTFVREFLARPAMAYGYAAMLLLIGIRHWMGPFAAVGRMALTNYLLHSLVFTTVANSYGLGLYGRIHPVQGLALCFGFYALQVPFSVWWLRTHNFGPAEWLWRSFTYQARQPWRKLAAAE